MLKDLMYVNQKLLNIYFFSFRYYNKQETAEEVRPDCQQFDLEIRQNQGQGYYRN